MDVSSYIQYVLMMIGLSFVVLIIVMILAWLKDEIVIKLKKYKYDKKKKNILKKNGKIPVKYKNFCIFCNWRGSEDGKCYYNVWSHGENAHYVRDDDFCSNWDKREE